MATRQVKDGISVKTSAQDLDIHASGHKYLIFTVESQ